MYLGLNYVEIHSILHLITGTNSYFTNEEKFYRDFIQIRFLHKCYAHGVKYLKDYLMSEII